MLTVVIAGILLLGMVSWLKTEKISGNVEEIVNQNTPELALAGNIRFQAVLLRVTNLKAVMYSDPAQKDALEKEAESQEQQLADWVKEYDKYAISPEQRSIYSQLRNLWDSYKIEGKKLREASRQNKTEEAQKLLLSAGQVGNELVKVVEDLRGYSAHRVEANGHEVVQLLSATKTSVLLFVTVTVVLSAVIGTLTTRSISKVLHRAADELSSGAEQTAAASGQVSSASQMLAEGASEQAATKEEPRRNQRLARGDCQHDQEER